MSTDRQTERIVRALGGVGEDLIAKAAPKYGESILPTEVHRVTFDKPELPDKKEVRAYRLKRAAAGLAAAAVVIAGGALLWVNREKIFTQGNTGAADSTTSVTEEHSPTWQTPEEALGLTFIQLTDAEKTFDSTAVMVNAEAKTREYNIKTKWYKFDGTTLIIRYDMEYTGWFGTTWSQLPQLTNFSLRGMFDCDDPQIGITDIVGIDGNKWEAVCRIRFEKAVSDTDVYVVKQYEGENNYDDPYLFTAHRTVSDTSENTVSQPVEYTYPKENVFVYENTLYEIDARAAFDYVIETDDGYQSIFMNEYPEYDGEGWVDPVRDCLKDEYFVGMLNYVNRMPSKSMETNFFEHGGANLYSFDPGNNSPAESTMKYIVADVNSKEVATILKYFSDKLTVPVDENDFGMLRGVYYVTAQTTVMPADYYDYLSRQDALNIAAEARYAEGMDYYFRTGTNYFSFPLPVFPSPIVSTLDEHGRLGEVTFYLGNGEGVYAAIVDNKVDKSWNVAPISEAFKKGEKVMFVSDSVNTAMLTSDGGRYIVRGSEMPFGMELVGEHYFPVRKYNVMNPPPQDYDLTETDLAEIYDKAYEAWVGAWSDSRSLGYPIKVNGVSGGSDYRGLWYVPVFEGDKVIGIVTAFFNNGEWLASSYGESGADQLTELYRSGEPFHITVFGSAQYICTEGKRSECFTYAVYDKPRNVYLYDETKAATLRRWKDSGQPSGTDTAEGYTSPAATFDVYCEYREQGIPIKNYLPNENVVFESAVSADGEGYMRVIFADISALREQFSDDGDELWDILAPYFENNELSISKLREEKPQVTLYYLFGSDPWQAAEYGIYRLSDDYILYISDALNVSIYRRTDWLTEIRRGIELLWRNYTSSDDFTVFAVTDHYDDLDHHRVEIIAPEEVQDEIKVIFEYNGISAGRFTFLTPEEKVTQSVPDDTDATDDMYFKEPTSEDIVTDPETGIRYVKNQLLISADPMCDREFIRELIEEAGAEIVGYIGLTNDYQIEFREDKTPEELQKIADTDFAYPGIWNVTLNIVSEISYE